MSKGSAPSPCRFASTRAALPLAAAAAPGCRERGRSVGGHSVAQNTERLRQHGSDGYRARFYTHGVRGERGGARRAARRACVCAIFLFEFSRCCLLPIGDFLGILNSRRSPLWYPGSRIRYQNVKRTKAEKVLCADKIRVRSLRRFRDSWGAKPDFFDAFLNFFERRREGHAIENPRCFHGSNGQVKDLVLQFCRV